MSEENYKAWVLYFEKLESLGIGYSLGDMKSKANELGLEIPWEVFKGFKGFKHGST